MNLVDIAGSQSTMNYGVGCCGCWHCEMSEVFGVAAAARRGMCAEHSSQRTKAAASLPSEPKVETAKDDEARAWRGALW